jgi:hypothetical protein
VADTVDPSAKRQAERNAQADTFEAIATEWLNLHKATWVDETISILEARLKSYLLPYLGKRPIAAITAQELLGVLRRVEARGRNETAHRVRSLAGRIFRFAVATGRATHDVAADLQDALVPVASRNFASVTDPAKVGELLRAIDGYTGQPITALALKLAPLVFVRPGESGPSSISTLVSGASPGRASRWAINISCRCRGRPLRSCESCRCLSGEGSTCSRRWSPGDGRCLRTPLTTLCGGLDTAARIRRDTVFAAWPARSSTSRGSPARCH